MEGSWYPLVEEDLLYEQIHLWSVDLWSCYVVTLPVLKGVNRLGRYDLSFVGTQWLYFVFRGVYSLVSRSSGQLLGISRWIVGTPG